MRKRKQCPQHWNADRFKDWHLIVIRPNMRDLPPPEPRRSCRSFDFISRTCRSSHRRAGDDCLRHGFNNAALSHNHRTDSRKSECTLEQATCLNLNTMRRGEKTTQVLPAEPEHGQKLKHPNCCLLSIDHPLVSSKMELLY